MQVLSWAGYMVQTGDGPAPHQRLCSLCWVRISDGLLALRNTPIFSPTQKMAKWANDHKRQLVAWLCEKIKRIANE